LKISLDKEKKLAWEEKFQKKYISPKDREKYKKSNKSKSKKGNFNAF
jgi:hypothetical protein